MTFTTKKKGRSKRYSQCPSFILKKKCCLGLYPFLHNEPLKPVTAFSLLTGPYGRWSHGLSHCLLLVFWVPSWPAGLSHQHHCRSNITRDFLAYYSGIMLVKHDVFNFLRVSTTFSLKERKQSRLEIWPICWLNYLEIKIRPRNAWISNSNWGIHFKINKKYYILV